MGLDMYLNKKIYVGAEYEHRKVKASIDVEVSGKKLQIDPSKVSYIIERAAYWRKANQVHAWFVINVQDGQDNCANYFVSGEKLQSLVDICKEILIDKSKANELLPPQKGFFFGSYDIDEWYLDNLKSTVEQLKDLDLSAEYEYHSSW